MRPEALKLLYDIDRACTLLATFTAGRSFPDYERDPLLQSAVERQFIIIGEALHRALRLEPALEQRVTDARSIVGLRHVMVHGYAAVEPATVWGVLETGLKTLQREVAALLAEYPPPR